MGGINLRIKLDMANLIFCSTLVFMQYLLFIRATTKTMDLQRYDFIDRTVVT